jgi:phosphopantothenoylcysteine decarboxylase/phosphopantothenate--cysteine ligase
MPPGSRPSPDAASLDAASREAASPDATPSGPRGPGGLDGPRILITAGPTHEPIDEVRFIGNRSSGRMGHAIAAAAAAPGATVTLLMGPAPVPETLGPSGIRVERFRTTADLQAALAELWPAHDILIMAAAVADYRPRPGAGGDAAGGKLRRTEGPLVLELESTPDLLAGVAAASRPDQTLIGFALEPPERLLESARDKLVRKGVHAIVANPLETMDGDEVAGTLVTPDGLRRPEPPRGPKTAFAAWLIEEVLTLHAARGPAQRGP